MNRRYAGLFATRVTCYAALAWMADTTFGRIAVYVFAGVTLSIESLIDHLVNTDDYRGPNNDREVEGNPR